MFTKQEAKSFGGLLWKRWWALMSCAVFTGIGIYGAATNKTNRWFFLASIAAALGMFIVAAAWAWLDEHRRAENKQRQLRQIEESRPRIMPREPDAVFVEQVTQRWQNGQLGIVPFLKVNFMNDPPHPYPSAVANDVMATIDHYDSGTGRHLLSIDGRWADSDQPSAINPLASRTHLLSTAFGIGRSHSLDIAYIDSQTHECFAWNNDNYDYPMFLCPQHRLQAQSFRVIVRLRGKWVDETLQFRFEIADGTFVIHR